MNHSLYYTTDPNHHLQRSYCFDKPPNISRNPYECQDPEEYHPLRFAILGERKPYCFRTHSKRKTHLPPLQNLVPHPLPHFTQIGYTSRKTIPDHTTLQKRPRCVDDLSQDHSFELHYPQNVNIRVKRF